MNFTKNLHDPALPAARPQPRRGGAAAARLAARAFLLFAGAALLASVAAAPAVVPYHARLRAVFVTLLPLTVGTAWGALDHAWVRRHVLPLLGGASVVLVGALAPRLRTDAPPLAILAALAGGVAVALALLRIGLLQAGVGWRNHRGNEPEDYAPRWYAAAALAFAWLWLAATLVNPRETFGPTRWLLTLLGDPPSAAALAPARVRLQRSLLTTAGIAPERGRVVVNGYDFRVGPLTPGPDSLQVAVSVRRADGRPFGAPVWVTLDADDPANPDPVNDVEYFDAGILPAGSPEAAATRLAARSPRVTAYAWYALTQSLPAIHLRARLWSLDSQDPAGLAFVPVAEADLGTWDLTPLRKLRPRRS